MKKVNKETDLNLVSLESMNHECFSFGVGVKYTYVFESSKYYPHDSLKVFYEADEAETIKEFRELNNLDKCDIVDFLNKNYKK